MIDKEHLILSITNPNLIFFLNTKYLEENNRPNRPFYDVLQIYHDVMYRQLVIQNKFEYFFVFFVYNLIFHYCSI